MTLNLSWDQLTSFCIFLLQPQSITSGQMLSKLRVWSNKGGGSKSRAKERIRFADISCISRELFQFKAKTYFKHFQISSIAKFCVSYKTQSFIWTFLFCSPKEDALFHAFSLNCFHLKIRGLHYQYKYSDVGFSKTAKSLKKKKNLKIK